MIREKNYLLDEKRNKHFIFKSVTNKVDEGEATLKFSPMVPSPPVQKSTASSSCIPASVEKLKSTVLAPYELSLSWRKQAYIKKTQFKESKREISSEWFPGPTLSYFTFFLSHFFIAEDGDSHSNYPLVD